MHLVTQTFTKISVLIPTRKRLGRLTTLLQSFHDTSIDGHAELVFRIDSDDVESQQFLVGYPKVVGPRGGGYADMPKFYNEMTRIADGNVLMCGNDDMIFRTKGWAERLLEVANQYPDGLFDLGVNTHNPTHFPFSCVSRSVVEQLGFIWDPRIFWGDMYLRDVMAWFGRTIMVHDVKIDHDWAGRKPDQTYYETLSPKAKVEGSRTYWAGPHAEAVRDAVSKLEGVMA